MLLHLLIGCCVYYFPRVSKAKTQLLTTIELAQDNSFGGGITSAELDAALQYVTSTDQSNNQVSHANSHHMNNVNSSLCERQRCFSEINFLFEELISKQLSDDHERNDRLLHSIRVAIDEYRLEKLCSTKLTTRSTN